MVYRGLDQDGNAGVVFERMAQVLLRCRVDGDDGDGKMGGVEMLFLVIEALIAISFGGEWDLSWYPAMI